MQAKTVSLFLKRKHFLGNAKILPANKYSGSEQFVRECNFFLQVNIL